MFKIPVSGPFILLVFDKLSKHFSCCIVINFFFHKNNVNKHGNVVCVCCYYTEAMCNLRLIDLFSFGCAIDFSYICLMCDEICGRVYAVECRTHLKAVHAYSGTHFFVFTWCAWQWEIWDSIINYLLIHRLWHKWSYEIYTYFGIFNFFFLSLFMKMNRVIKKKIRVIKKMSCDQDLSDNISQIQKKCNR